MLLLGFGVLSEGERIVFITQPIRQLRVFWDLLQGRCCECASWLCFLVLLLRGLDQMIVSESYVLSILKAMIHTSASYVSDPILDRVDIEDMLMGITYVDAGCVGIKREVSDEQPTDCIEKL